MTPRLGWGAILAYLIAFVGYHALNIRSGAESFRMFLAMSFYTTGSLIYGYLFRNTFNLMNALAVRGASRRKVQQQGG